MGQRSLILFLFLSFCQPCYSQTILGTDSLSSSLHSLAKGKAPENISLQTSKGIYESGEDLWFKTYILDEQFLAPSILSQIPYLQLISESSNKALWQENYEVQRQKYLGKLDSMTKAEQNTYFLPISTQGLGEFEFKVYKNITR